MRCWRLNGFAAALAAVLLAMALALGAVGPASAQKIDEVPRIAVISAFEPELAVLRDAVESRRIHTHNGNSFAVGTLDGHEVVLFLSGVGMVNAAMTTQLALERFNISAIVFSGIAGGVDPALHIGDLVVPDQWGAYLHMVIARDAGGGGHVVPPFFGKPFANYGMMYPQLTEVRRAGAAKVEQRFWFKADPLLVAAAARAAEQLNLERCAAAKCLERAPQVIVGGNGVSGSAFVDNKAFRQYVFDTFSARVLDMESAAVAHVAYANGVRFVVVRALSDLAGGEDGANQLATFFALAADNSAAMVRALLKSLPR